MKPAPTGVRSLRTSTPSRDRAACISPPFILAPSPIATSSRVRLPPSPSFTPPLSFFQQRYASTSPAVRGAPPALSPSEDRPSLEWKHGSGSVFNFGNPKHSARSVSTSSPVLAQLSERDIEDYDDGSSSAIPFTAAEVAKLSPRYQPFVPPQVPGSPVSAKGKGKQVAEYEPTDADFGPVDPIVGDDVSWVDGYQADLEDGRQMDIWEEPSTVKPKRRTKKVRLKTLDLPPLMAGEGLPVEQERFPWHKTALSQIKRREGTDRWFVEQRGIQRNRAKIVPLKPTDPFFKPVERYEDHFEPLIKAEHTEEQRAHSERQLQWSYERLMKEGWMVEELGGSRYTNHRKKTHIYTFARTGKASSGDLPFHQFRPGTVTEVCRTHPHYDYVELDGNVREPPPGSQYPSAKTVTDTPLLSGSSIEKLLGTVYSFTKKYIRVEFETSIQDLEKGHWRLDVGCNDIAVKRQLEAIRYLHADPTEMERADAIEAAHQAKYASLVRPFRSDEDEAFNEPTRRATQQTIFQGTNLRDKILRVFQADFEPHNAKASLDLRPNTPAVDVPANPTQLLPGDIDATPVPPPHPVYEPPSILSKNELIASWTKRYRTESGKEPVRVEGDPIVPLNATQMRAIAMMLSERLSLVQGPPGTGKTRVIIETIKLLKHHWKIPQPILVTAHTNAAVDNLLSGLRDHGVKAVRLGKEQVVREDLREWTLERQQETHPLFGRWEELGEKVLQMNNTISGIQGVPLGDYAGMSKSQIQVERATMQKKRGGMRQGIVRDILLDADVVCTTCLSAASRTLDAIDFPVVFLDEASMATEPLSLIPLMKGSSHAAIIGDHKQLPPIIISEAGQKGGLATSMFERLIHEHNIPSIMLDTQYRMHPQISHFPNRAFYASALANGTANAEGIVNPGFEPPITDFLIEDDDGKRQNMTFVHHDSPEDPSSKSLRNEGEAERVCSVVTDLLLKNPTLTGNDIGVITPYVAQIRQLTEYLRQDPDFKAKFISILGEERAKEVETVEIRTVDGFEGREKAVIVFSTVRNNPGGYIGFMADWRRLNVGLTRAKRGLIILGSADHLARAKVGQKAAELLPSGGAQIWRELMAWLKAEGLILRDDQVED